MMPCLECSTPLTKSTRGKPRRFCSSACSQKFNNRRASRGMILYDLFRAMRRDRADAKALGIWTEMCRLELAWNDEDGGARTWKPARMALADIEDADIRPRTNIYLKRDVDVSV